MRQAQRPRFSHLLLKSAIWIIASALPAAAQAIPHLTPTVHHHSPSDLELTGLLPGLNPGASRFLTARQLASLPQTAFDVTDDNLPGPPVHVEGVLLTVLREALAIPPQSDLIDALCTDQYRTHYPADYLAAHHPLLALKINGQPPAAWAAAAHARDPGPYFITHDHFIPAFQVLSHKDEPQIPTNVIRLNFTTAAKAYGPITSPGATLAVAQGFTIAKQNCLRCHFSGDTGGTKSGRDWQILSLLARQKPDYFTGYIHNPKSKDPNSQMPPFPEYDEATLNALMAYFRAFPSK